VVIKKLFFFSNTGKGIAMSSSNYFFGTNFIRLFGNLINFVLRKKYIGKHILIIEADIKYRQYDYNDR